MSRSRSKLSLLGLLLLVLLLLFLPWWKRSELLVNKNLRKARTRSLPPLTYIPLNIPPPLGPHGKASSPARNEPLPEVGSPSAFDLNPPDLPVELLPEIHSGNLIPSSAWVVDVRFGVVDVGRILGESPRPKDMTEAWKLYLRSFQPDQKSPRSRANLMPELRTAVAELARARGLEMVFDVSSRSPVEPPLVVSLPEVPDLTDEVIRRLFP